MWWLQSVSRLILALWPFWKQILPKKRPETRHPVWPSWIYHVIHLISDQFSHNNPVVFLSHSDTVFAKIGLLRDSGLEGGERGLGVWVGRQGAHLATKTQPGLAGDKMSRIAHTPIFRTEYFYHKYRGLFKSLKQPHMILLSFCLCWLNNKSKCLPLLVQFVQNLDIIITHSDAQTKVQQVYIASREIQIMKIWLNFWF